MQRPGESLRSHWSSAHSGRLITLASDVFKKAAVAMYEISWTRCGQMRCLQDVRGVLAGPIKRIADGQQIVRCGSLKRFIFRTKGQA